jgi:mono/diheme cytochrome c family protein
LKGFAETKGGLESSRALRLLSVIVLAALFALPMFTSAQALRNNSNSTSAVGTARVQDSVSGKELFNQHCASCHFPETTVQKIGPGLKGLYRRLTFSDGKKVADLSLAKWIEAGGKNMPGFKETIKPEQIRQLISYIRTL